MCCHHTQYPVRGYYPEFSKTVLDLHPYNIESRKLFLLHCGFKVYMGARYLVGYIRDDESKLDWVKKHMYMWERNICKISETAGKYPQEIYAAVGSAIQLELIFIQCVTNNTVDAFAGVEKMIQENFLPCLSISIFVSLYISLSIYLSL